MLNCEQSQFARHYFEWMLGFIWKAACLACNSSKSKLLYLEAANRHHPAGEMLGADFLLYHPEYKKIGIRGLGLNNTDGFQCLIRGMLEWIFSPGASVQQCEDPRMLAEQASEVLWGWARVCAIFPSGYNPSLREARTGTWSRNDGNIAHSLAQAQAYTEPRTTCPGMDATHNGLCSPPSRNDQDSPPQRGPQASLIWAVPQLRPTS